jgi:hypothetical protein
MKSGGSRPATKSVLEYLVRREPQLDVVAEEVRFHSPAADYAGRADVMHVFAAISSVLDEVLRLECRPTTM